VYYRVAIQVDASSPWRWKSTALSSLDVVFQWLRLYHALPQDRLRVFSSCSRGGMNEQLVRVNQGLESTSVTAAQFLKERMIGSSAVVWEHQQLVHKRTSGRHPLLSSPNHSPTSSPGKHNPRMTEA